MSSRLPRVRQRHDDLPAGTIGFNTGRSPMLDVMMMIFFRGAALLMPGRCQACATPAAEPLAARQLRGAIWQWHRLGRQLTAVAFWRFAEPSRRFPRCRG